MIYNKTPSSRDEDNERERKEDTVPVERLNTSCSGHQPERDQVSERERKAPLASRNDKSWPLGSTFKGDAHVDAARERHPASEEQMSLAKAHASGHNDHIDHKVGPKRRLFFFFSEEPTEIFFLANWSFTSG